MTELVVFGGWVPVVWVELELVCVLVPVFVGPEPVWEPVEDDELDVDEEDELVEDELDVLVVLSLVAVKSVVASPPPKIGSALLTRPISKPLLLRIRSSCLLTTPHATRAKERKTNKDCDRLDRRLISLPSSA